MSWSVYILRCKDSKLYTGITNNLEQRIKAHNSGRGGRFTKYRTPVDLLYEESCPDKPAALKREFQIKRLTRAEKIKLIAASNPAALRVDWRPKEGYNINLKT